MRHKSRYPYSPSVKIKCFYAKAKKEYEHVKKCRNNLSRWCSNKEPGNPYPQIRTRGYTIILHNRKYDRTTPQIHKTVMRGLLYSQFTSLITIARDDVPGNSPSLVAFNIWLRFAP